MGKKDETAKLNKNPILVKAAFFAVLFVLVSIPLFRNYIPDTGDSEFWAIRLAGMSALVTKPVLYRAVMMFLNAAGIASAYAMFMAAFKEVSGETTKIGVKEHEIMSAVGCALFVLSPYRFYVSYEMCDYSEMLLLIFIPLVLMSVVACIRRKSVAAGLACVILLVLTGALFAVKYVYPTVTFAEGGYAFGDLLLTFRHTEYRPGIGMPVILGFFVSIYAVTKEKKSPVFIFAIPAFATALFSLRIFPWDVLARSTPAAEKIIRHFGSPSFFVGLSCMFFCFPAAKGIFFLMKDRNKNIKLLSAILLILTAAVWLFLCSSAMYFQYPLE